MTNETPYSDSVSRRKYLAAVSASTVAALAGCDGDGGNGNGNGNGGNGNGGGTSTDTPTEGETTGNSNGGDASYHFGFSIKNMNNPWLQVFRRIGELYGDALGHDVTVSHAGGDAQTQIQNVRSMLNEGIDALLISPYSSDATVGVIEDAVDDGVPVYTANSSAPTEAVSMFTGFGSFDAGYRAGELMAQALNDEYDGSRIVDLVGDQADQSAVRRSNGFKEAISETDGVEVVREIFNEGWSQQEATQNLRSYLQTDSDIHGIYAVWGGGALAAVNVLDQEGMLATRDNTDEYIPIMNIDGFPGVLDGIRDGHIHTVLQQPMPFYAPISMEYMIHQLETGSPSIPEPGSEVAAADSASLPSEVAVENFETNGVQPLSEAYWAPGTVTDWELDGTAYYPWLKPKTVSITQDNVDAEYLWGNYAEDIL